MNEVSVMPWAMKRKKFYCCSCGEKLIPYPKIRVLKRGDPDYKKYNSFGRGRRLIGDIELAEYDFKCMSCDKFISYEEQCVIAEIQKCLGKQILSQDSINENYEKAKADLERKGKIRSVISKVFCAVITFLVVYYWLASGNSPFKVYF